MRYSDGFKARMVGRLVGPGGPSARSLAAEAGVSAATLHRWRHATLRAVGDKHEHDDTVEVKAERPTTAMEKAKLVAEASQLSDAQLGAFLRRHGVFEAELVEWREAMEEAFQPKNAKVARQRQVADQKLIKKLERELRTKEKALAEAAALLILQKKFGRSGGPRTTTRARPAADDARPAR